MPKNVVNVDNKELADEIQYRIDRLEALRLQLEKRVVTLTVQPPGPDAGANTIAHVEAAIKRLTEAREAVRATCGWQGMYCLFEVEGQ